MLRTTTIALLLLLTVGIMLPYGNSAHGLRQSTQVGVRRNHRYHSRAWWRRYRARIRAKRAAALAHRNASLTLPESLPVGNLISVAPLAAPTAPMSATNTTALSPAANTGVTLPGQMNLSVVALSRQNPAFLTSREAAKMLAGINIADLRRIVIDKMLDAGGWVTNDFIREVNGARVFVVTARTPRDARSPEKAWSFYFTEAGGRIYGLTTDSRVEFAEQMSSEAERLISSLHSSPGQK
jgi:hypothetical protein